MKKLNQKGFTLAELLIVVAIIAVLVAVSIPVFTTQLEKSREETDTANLRSAFAIAQADALTENYKKPDGSGPQDPYQKGTDDTYWAYYDIKAGTLSKDDKNAAGKGTATEGNCDPFEGPNIYYKQEYNARSKYLHVLIEEKAGELPVACAGFAASGAVDSSSDFVS